MENDILMEVLKIAHKKEGNTIKIVLDRTEYEMLEARLLELKYIDTYIDLVFLKVMQFGDKKLLINVTE